MSSDSLRRDAPVGEPLSQIAVVPLRHPWRWAAAVIVLALAGAVLWSVATNTRFQWEVVGNYFFSASILAGLWTTIWLTAVSMTIAIALGTVLALMRLSPNPVLRGAATGYVWLFRGTPLLVQLIFLFNFSALYPSIGAAPWAFSMNEVLTPLTVAILGLSLNEAAYTAEIVRGGLRSVDHGQHEAAQALGLTRGSTIRRIILPQAMRVIVPPLGNETISMLKYTSLVSVIALPELLYSAQLIYSRTFETIPLLVVACIWYLIVTTVLTVAQALLERRFGRGDKVAGVPWGIRLRTSLLHPRAALPIEGSRP